MKIYKESKLDNGLTIITSEDPNTDVVTLSVWVRAGSRYEKRGERGYAHILEHMLLKGTKKRPSIFDVNVIMDRAGAMSNAATTVEMVRVHIEVIKDQMENMFDILADIVRNPLIDGAVLENEKKVILQEYDSAYDNPGRRAGLESSNRVFEGHPLSQNALGDKESIKSATVDLVKNYHERMFLPQRMAVVVAGGASHEKIVELARVHFGTMEARNDRDVDNFSPPYPHCGFAFEMMPTAQTQLNFSFLSPGMNIKESVAMGIYATFLGYKHTSLLYENLRHELGLVYSVGVYNVQYSDAGLFYISTSTTKPQEVIPVIIDRVVNARKYFKKELFEIYKEQLINIATREASASSNGIGYLGNAWLYFGRIIAPDERNKIIRGIAYDEMIEMIERLITKNNLFVMAVGEKKFSIDL